MNDSGNNGIVYLIGAGPGDPGLITVKGKRLLDNCDVVIYDNLVPDELVVTLPFHVEMHYVGKKAGKPCCSQDYINNLMVTIARTGKRIARLKGSDPLIFGRGGEEAKFLKDNGIPYEIVPGVTAGVAVPAYSGIPPTDRNLASFVMFVTGHKAREKKLSTVPWDWVAKARGGTIVIYMGVGEIAGIVKQLIDGGMNPATPAAAIERGTFPSQKTLISTIENLPADVIAKGVRPPALFVIGDVVSLSSWLEWFKDKPLLGVRVMVLRAAAAAQELYENLRELGAEVQPYATIGFDDHDDPENWNEFKRLAQGNHWLIFTSETGVRHFMRQYLDRVGDIRSLGHFKIAAIGKGTAGNLAEFGLKPDFIPENATAVDFGREFTSNVDLNDATVVRIRGTLAGDTIEKSVAETGARVIPLTVYKTFYPKWPDGFTPRLFEYPPDAIVFTSGSTVKGLFNNLSEDEIRTLTEKAAVFSIGPATSKVLRKYKLDITVEAKPHNLNALTEQLIEYFQSQHNGGSS